MIRFTILGEPKGKGRHRTTKQGIVFTPKETVAYENLVVASYKGQVGQARFKDDSQLSINIKAYFKIPKSASKKKRAEMLDSNVRPTKKPDFDNIGKIIADSLNGIAYRDDSQLVSGTVEKYYSENPRVEVEIYEVGGTDCGNFGFIK